MSMWIFWLQLFIIICLLVFIYIRDEAVRRRIQHFFSWAKKKIKVARIKSEINSQWDAKKKLIPELGSKYWDYGINDDEMAETSNKLSELKQKESSLLSEIDRSENEIKQSVTQKNERIETSNGKIDELLNQKKPLENELKEIEKEFSQLNKELKELIKQKQKIEKQIESSSEDLNRIDDDDYLSNIEKNNKKEETNAQISTLKTEFADISHRIEQVQGDNPSAIERQDRLKPQIEKINNEVKAIKDQLSQFKRDSETRTKSMEQSLKQQRSDLQTVQKNIHHEYVILGEYLNSHRIQSAELDPIYAQIDECDRNISELNRKLVKVNKKAASPELKE